MHVLLKHISKYGILFIIVAEGFSHSSKCHRQITCRLKVDLNIFDEFSGNVKQEKCTLLNSFELYMYSFEHDRRTAGHIQNLFLNMGYCLLLWQRDFPIQHNTSCNVSTTFSTSTRNVTNYLPFKSRSYIR
jgi:hypothetical protein